MITERQRHDEWRREAHLTCCSRVSARRSERCSRVQQAGGGLNKKNVHGSIRPSQLFSAQHGKPKECAQRINPLPQRGKGGTSHAIPFHSLQAPKSPRLTPPLQGRVKSDLQGFFGWGGTKRLAESTLRCWTGAPARWHVRQQAVTPSSQKAACSKVPSHHIRHMSQKQDSPAHPSSDPQRTKCGVGVDSGGCVCVSVAVAASPGNQSPQSCQTWGLPFPLSREHE